MPSPKQVRQRRRFGGHNRGGRVKDALDWGAKRKRALARKEASAIKKPRMDAWSPEDDAVVRSAWGHENETALFENLAEETGRSFAAVFTRAYSLGLRRLSPEQLRAYKERAARRRARIDEALLKGQPRTTLAKELGCSTALIEIRRGDLVFAGHQLPSVPWWTTNEGPLWKTIANQSYSEFRDRMQRGSGVRCKCSHYSSEHYNGVCIAVRVDGAVCGCVGFGDLERISKYIASIDAVPSYAKSDGIALKALLAADVDCDGFSDEISECLRDDQDRFVQMRYIGKSRLHYR